LVWQVAAVAAVALSFLAVNAYVEARSKDTEAEATQIAERDVPEIDRLTAVRTELRRMQVAYAAALEEAEHGVALRAMDIERLRAQRDRALASYRALEHVASPELEALVQQLARSDDDGRRALDLARHGRFGAAELVVAGPLRDEMEAADRSLYRLTEIDTGRAHASAGRIRTTRRSTARTALILDCMCLALAGVATVMLASTVARRVRLTESYRQIVERRAEELELFAGRVAHDVMSPLGAVRISLEMARRRHPGDTTLGEHVARATSGMDRAQQLVDGLLAFARAGARPRADARASLVDGVEAVAAELAPLARAHGVTIEVEPFPRLEVACDPGVLTSVLSNLVSNAIKYMGERPVRRVQLCAAGGRARARVDVCDTGPGVPPGKERAVFEPFVRMAPAHQPGVGLGLATVKRVVEAHGGAVGVYPAPSGGACFWFELPLAAPPREPK
jgi:signal transduction histidine kinase